MAKTEKSRLAVGARAYGEWLWVDPYGWVLVSKRHCARLATLYGRLVGLHGLPDGPGFRRAVGLGAVSLRALVLRHALTQNADTLETNVVNE